MKVEFWLHHDIEKEDIIKNLIDELKKKNANIIKERRFNTDLELDVNLFDEVVNILKKYSNDIDIKLNINTNSITLSISKTEFIPFREW